MYQTMQDDFDKRSINIITYKEQVEHLKKLGEGLNSFAKKRSKHKNKL